MKKTSYWIASAAMLGIACLIFVSMPAAQNRTIAPPTVTTSAGLNRSLDTNPENKPTPRMADGHMSFTGFWPGGAPAATDANPNAAPTDAAAAAANAPTVHELTKTADGSLFFSYAGANGSNNGPTRYAKIEAPYKPEYVSKVQKIIDVQYGITNIYDPNLDCKPAGVPRAGFGGFVVSFPEAVAVLYEATPGPYYRIIYTDGRPHPTDYDTAYMGHSIGRWEGDTLVVDTVGLDDTTWLQGPGSSLHSDQEHVVERWTRKGNLMTIETTVEDPVMFTKPWVLPTRRVALMNGDPSTYGNYIMPAMCNTNDKAHFRVDDKYVCNWCNPESVYGGDATKTTQGKPVVPK